MAYLNYPSTTEVQLQLDAKEGAILAVVRGCPWWTKADIERALGSTLVTSVTLTTTQAMDSTLRRILRMSFGLVFPKEGGVGHHPVRAHANITQEAHRSS